MKRPGELALVLHTHMPYVEGFGTWPFGEEWLWEAIATSYVPLLDVLGRAAMTVSLTPVLCDQLEAPGAIERCLRWLREVRPESHRLDIESLRSAGEDVLAAELERSAAEYAAVADRLEAMGGDLLNALAPHASWTSAATHAVLPLLATDAGVALQVETGIASHRRRFGHWSGGFWLPECAHAPWLDGLLEDCGVHSMCVELTDAFGLGAPEHLRPLVTDEGPVLWPIDRQSIALVWSDGGYPAAGAYRDYHHHTEHRHRAWGNDGSAYDHGVARALAREHAADFVARVRSRVREGGVCVVALDTELLGHWWYEGVAWLEAVLDEAASQGLALANLDEALGRQEPAPASPILPETTWGRGGDLSTWSAPGVADLAWQARTAELAVIRAGGRAPARAVRELLALQASDWAFLATRELAGDYPRERMGGHADALARALSGADAGALEGTVRNLAPDLIVREWL
ncbi:MAG TPA: 1,4-alpha-glucan branching protein domain-containing protein [Solirubrobacteraceae bacterium]|jgi:1,4-alpha-glucan branching enzyme|nr:1,4-alpha-glucan branching protein domain-containing protein [Solirubrobacteraceae bacterium]